MPERYCELRNAMLVRYHSQAGKLDLSPNTQEVGPLPLPCLSRNSKETLPLASGEYRKAGNIHLWNEGELTLGCASLPVTNSTLQTVAGQLYDQIFELTEQQYLLRIWNYIPEINAGEGDQERYRQFCVSRADSFHRFFAQDQNTNMPAGTCVGIRGDDLVILFLAGRAKPDHHENPQQTPAYRYPRQYGPKAPSFARATTSNINDKHYRFISGTAAVIGHESQAAGDLPRQVEITCDNLERIAAQTLVDSPHTASAQNFGSGKVYLKHASDFEPAKQIIEKRFPDFADQLVYLHSDICRKELLIEIELSFIDPIRPH